MFSTFLRSQACHSPIRLQQRRKVCQKRTCQRFIRIDPPIHRKFSASPTPKPVFSLSLSALARELTAGPPTCARKARPRTMVWPLGRATLSFFLLGKPWVPTDCLKFSLAVTLPRTELHRVQNAALRRAQAGEIRRLRSRRIIAVFEAGDRSPCSRPVRN